MLTFRSLPLLLSTFVITQAVFLSSAIADPAKSAAGKGAIEVIIYPVDLDSKPQTLELLGKLKAKQAIEVRANVSEILQKSFISDGQTVAQGALLFELSDQQELAELKQAKINAAEKKRQYLRAKKLRGQGSITEAVIDERKAIWLSAEAEVEIMQAQVDDRQIRAPFAGQVGLIEVSHGDLITPSSILTTLDDTSALFIDLQIPGQYQDAVYVGQKIQVFAPAPATMGRVYELTDQQVEAEVIAISPRLDSKTLLLPVRALISQPKNVKSGMVVKSKIALRAQPSLMITNSAILMLGERKFVYRIKNLKSNQLSPLPSESFEVEKVEVKLGQRLPQFTEVIDGLNEGDIVISQGVLRLSPRSKVTIKAIQTDQQLSLKPNSRANLSSNPNPKAEK